jgi:hypothetical protein
MSVVSAGSVKGAGSRQVPAAVSRHRERVVISSALCVAAVLVVVPALLLRPMRDAGVLGFTLGPAIAFGLEIFLVELPEARGKTRRLSPTSRYLTAPTWSGMRTIDLHDLCSVRARLISGHAGSITYVVVTDGAGARMSFSGKRDIERIRDAVEHWMRKDAPAVRVSGLAASVLGLKPLRFSQVALYSLWSFVPLMLAILAIGGVITALAA